jgi:SAM-dependent methyltransferase
VPDRGPINDVLEYYDRILPFYEKEQEAIPEERLAFWRRTARARRPRRILDVGSGLGRITAILSEEAPTLGIDVSLTLLSRAVRRVPGASFAVADMRHAACRGNFDLVTASSDPFCHLLSSGDRHAALCAVAGQLAPGGSFVLEGLRPPAGSGPPPRQLRHAAGLLTIEEIWSPLGPDSLWRVRYRYRDRADTGEVTRVDATFTARAWEPEELRSLSSTCGLSVEDVAGDFDGRPFQDGSPRVLVVARRA